MSKKTFKLRFLIGLFYFARMQNFLIVHTKSHIFTSKKGLSSRFSAA